MRPVHDHSRYYSVRLLCLLTPSRFLSLQQSDSHLDATYRKNCLHTARFAYDLTRHARNQLTMASICSRTDGMLKTSNNCRPRITRHAGLGFWNVLWYLAPVCRFGKAVTGIQEVPPADTVATTLSPQNREYCAAHHIPGSIPFAGSRFQKPLVLQKVARYGRRRHRRRHENGNTGYCSADAG